MKASDWCIFQDKTIRILLLYKLSLSANIQLGTLAKFHAIENFQRFQNIGLLDRSLEALVTGSRCVRLRNPNCHVKYFGERFQRMLLKGSADLS